jgi:outer membrane protein OmpA-like peptidoglycan-associated protein
MKKLPLLLALALVPALLGAQAFRFRHTKGEKYHMTTEVTEQVSIGGRLNNTAEILNRIAVETVDTRGGSGLLRGTFQVSEKAQGAGGLFRAKDDTYTSEFWRDERGRYTIGKQHLFPIVRSIPVFPEEPIAQGRIWIEQGEEVHDLRDPFGIMQPLSVPLQVVYTYVGNQVRDGVEVAVLKVSYSAVASLRNVRSPKGLVPIRIMGSSEQTLYFDAAQGRIHSYEDTFLYVYLLSTGEFIEYEGSSKGKAVYPPPMDRARILEDIRRSIEEKKIPDTSVRADDEGITIALENIQFPPDSDALLPVERAKLDKIAEILKRYPERDLLVTGHTALAGTAEGRQELSDRRARVVGDYLLQLGVRDRTRMTFRGVGATQPLADNTSEAGMRRNRRVEIKLLEN